ncbi:MAG: universal stress protein [Dehalococcoidia bacterium]|nr:universal stress protein [Dehalococcoidia bacterium]
MRIVITCDGSEVSRRALLAAAPLVREWGAEVTVAGILDPGHLHGTISNREIGPDTGHLAEFARGRGAPVTPPPRVVEDRGAAMESARVDAKELLAELAALNLPGIAAEVRVEWDDDPAAAIVRVAKDVGAALIVMSTHGRSGLGQALMGSTTADVVKRSPVPVLVVGNGVHVG